MEYDITDKAWLIGYEIGTYILPILLGIMITHSRKTVFNQLVFHEMGKRGILFMAQLEQLALLPVITDLYPQEKVIRLTVNLHQLVGNRKKKRFSMCREYGFTL